MVCSQSWYSIINKKINKIFVWIKLPNQIRNAWSDLNLLLLLYTLNVCVCVCANCALYSYIRTLTFWMHIVCIVHKVTVTLYTIHIVIIYYCDVFPLSLPLPTLTDHCASPSASSFLYLHRIFPIHLLLYMRDILPLAITKHIHLHHKYIFYMFVY